MARTVGSRNLPWEALVKRAVAHQGRWIFPQELAHVPERTIDVIRRRRRHALRLTDGVIRVRKVAEAITADDHRVTLAIRYERKESA